MKPKEEISVGNTVYFDDVYNSTKRHTANFRGWYRLFGVVIWKGKQLFIERERIHKRRNFKK